MDKHEGRAAVGLISFIVRAAHGAIVAVLVALRPVNDSPFQADDIAILEALAGYAGPYLAA